MAEVALARGDLITAGRWADQEVAASAGWHQARALTTRARIAIAKGEPDQAERDAHKALARAAGHKAHLAVPDILECLGRLVADGDRHRDAARLLGAANEIRRNIGAVRFKIYDADYEHTVAALREAMGEHGFDTAWGKGPPYRSTKRSPTCGGAAGNANVRPAAGRRSPRLSAMLCDSSLRGWPTTRSPPGYLFPRRTVQTHLTHVYAKLDIGSRVLLAHEGASHG